MVDGSSWAWQSIILEHRIDASAQTHTAQQHMTKRQRAKRARQDTPPEWRLKKFERILGRINQSLGEAAYLSGPQDLGAPLKTTPQFTVGVHKSLSNAPAVVVALPWEALPQAADPCSFMNLERGLRKRQQIDNLLALLRPLVKPGDHIVDFCGGAGHMSIPLALLFPKCVVTLLDAKLESISLARRRLSECSLTNHRVHHGLVQDFRQPFQVGLALHACGAATDMCQIKCVGMRASYILCSCCVGKVNKMRQLFCSKGRDAILYPRSARVRSLCSAEEFSFVAKAADFNTSAVDQHDLRRLHNYRRCKEVVEMDRNCYAQEHDYCTALLRMQPLTATPKNDIIVGVHTSRDAHKWNVTARSKQSIILNEISAVIH